jgi:hypothetical protein
VNEEMILSKSNPPAHYINEVNIIKRISQIDEIDPANLQE